MLRDIILKSREIIRLFYTYYFKIEACRGAGAQSVTVNGLVVGSITTRGDEIFT